jgi:hypothetical protein
MVTTSGGDVGREVTGMTVSVTTPGAFGASGLGQFAGGGLVDSASFVLLLEENAGLFACDGAGIQSFAEKIVPLLLSRR